MTGTRGCTTILSIIMFVAISDPARPAWAYLDPASGSMFVQLLLGGIAGAGVMLKLYWRQFIEWLRGGK